MPDRVGHDERWRWQCSKEWLMDLQRQKGAKILSKVQPMDLRRQFITNARFARSGGRSLPLRGVSTPGITPQESKILGGPVMPTLRSLGRSGAASDAESSKWQWPTQRRAKRCPGQAGRQQCPEPCGPGLIVIIRSFYLSNSPPPLSSYPFPLCDFQQSSELTPLALHPQYTYFHQDDKGCHCSA